MIGIVLAQPVPAPITFKVSVNGYSIGYSDTEVFNTRTQEKLTAEQVSSLKITNGIGYFDLQEFKLGYQTANSFFNYAGDKLNVRVCDLHPSCTFSIYITTRDPIKNTFKLSIIDSTIPVDRYRERIQCFDGSFVYDDLYLCPVQPQPKPLPEPETIYVCSDGTKVESSDKCPIESKEHADRTVKEIVLVGGVAALGFAALYLYYRRKKQYTRAEKMAKTYISRRKK